MANRSSIRCISGIKKSSQSCLGDNAITASRAFSSNSSPLLPHTSSSQRSKCFSTNTSSRASTDTQLPRWKQTPEGMKMPFRIRPRDTTAEAWKCNDDPMKLSLFYNRFLGRGGDEMLSEETSWLAVTHKSFDQGKRGFNDRLSYIGKRIVELQASLALVSQPCDALSAPQDRDKHGRDKYGRHAFLHPLLDGVGNLTDRQKAMTLSKVRIAALAERNGMDEVLRWQPKKLDNMSGSGRELVMTQAVYAIVGAVALERGGEMANRVVRERILAPLGLNSRGRSR